MEFAYIILLVLTGFIVGAWHITFYFGPAKEFIKQSSLASAVLVALTLTIGAVWMSVLMVGGWQ